MSGSNGKRTAPAMDAAATNCSNRRGVNWTRHFSGLQHQSDASRSILKRVRWAEREAGAAHRRRHRITTREGCQCDQAKFGGRSQTGFLFRGVDQRLGGAEAHMLGFVVEQSGLACSSIGAAAIAACAGGAARLRTCGIGGFLEAVRKMGLIVTRHNAKGGTSTAELAVLTLLAD
jgi:hypothetical protein